MRFSKYIAKRYLFSKSSTSAINIITAISIVSIIAGTAVLFIVLSAFSGLRDFNVDITSTIDPDLKILPTSGKTLLVTKATEADIKAIDGILNFSNVIEERAFLEFKGKTQLAYIKGVDQNYTVVNPIRATILKGEWPQQGAPEVAIGIGIHHNLSLGVNDYTAMLKVMVPKPGKGQIIDPSQAFKSSKAITSAIFQASDQLDESHIFAPIDFAADLLNYDVDTVSAVEVRLTDTADEAEVKAVLQNLFDNQAVVKNRTELNDALYKMLNTENLALYFICTLVLIIALFSFIGSLIMIILDKRKNIKTYADLGASLREIRNIFFYQGLYMIFIGGSIGLLLGAGIVWLQQTFQLVMITQTLPYPITFTLWNVLLVSATILSLGAIAARLASSKIKPALLAKI